jgi:hypothetical protein
MTAAWAVGYAALGWRSFPIWAGKKNPIFPSNWRNDATTDPELIRQYWPSSADRNIAVVCGEAFDAWDIEVAHLDLLATYMADHGYAFPGGPKARTGRGGMHVLTEPTGVNGSRYLYLDGVHIGELKSTGGYILVSPSVTEGPYLWLDAPQAMALYPAPGWMLGLLEAPKTIKRFVTRVGSVDDGVARLKALAEAVEACPEGKRNNYLYWAMRRALEEGVPPKYAGQALLDAGRAAGLDEHEAKATVRSAYEAEGMEQ